MNDRHGHWCLVLEESERPSTRLANKGLAEAHRLAFRGYASDPWPLGLIP
jgi:hypothetical protein